MPLAGASACLGTRYGFGQALVAKVHRVVARRAPKIRRARAGLERHQRTSAVPREIPGTDDVRRAPCCRVDRSDSPDTLAVLWRTWLLPNSGCSRKRRGSARRRERRPRRRATFPSASASAVMIRASTRSGTAQRSITRLVQPGISVNAVRRSSASARPSLVRASGTRGTGGLHFRGVMEPFSLFLLSHAHGSATPSSSLSPLPVSLPSVYAVIHDHVRRRRRPRASARASPSAAVKSDGRASERAARRSASAARRACMFVGG